MLDALKAADVSDRVRTAAETVYQALSEAECTSVIGAAPHERSEGRVVATGVRADGYREVLGFAVATVRTARSGPRSAAR